MHRGIVAYFVILVILIIIAVYLFYFYNKGTVTPITVTTIPGQKNTSTTSIINNVTTSSTSTAPTSTVYLSGCISKNATLGIPNGNFSTGTYAYWNVSGPGFGTKPLNRTALIADGSYYGNTTNPWGNYQGNFFASNFKTGVGLQAGNLTSNSFAAAQLYLNFKLISSQSQLLYVQILQNNTPVITTHYNTYVSPPGSQDPQSTFVNASIPLGTMLCQNVSIRLVAGVTGKSSQGNGYIAAGDFYLSKTPAKNLTQPTSQTIIS